MEILKEEPEAQPLTNEQIAEEIFSDNSGFNLPQNGGDKNREIFQQYSAELLRSGEAKVLWTKITNGRNFSDYLPPIPPPQPKKSWLDRLRRKKETPNPNLVWNEKAARVLDLCGQYKLDYSKTKRAIGKSESDLQLVYNLCKDVFKIPPEVICLGMLESRWLTTAHNFYTEKSDDIVVSDLGVWQLNRDTALKGLSLQVTDVRDLEFKRSDIINKILELKNLPQTPAVKKQLNELRKDRDNLSGEIKERIDKNPRDERSDTVIATIAALHRLKTLYEQTYKWERKEMPKDQKYTDSRRWYFAMFAYNRGEGAIGNIYAKVGGDPEKYAKAVFEHEVLGDKKYQDLLKTLTKEKAAKNPDQKKIKQLEKRKDKMEHPRELEYSPSIYGLRGAIAEYLKNPVAQNSRQMRISMAEKVDDSLLGGNQKIV